MTKIEAVLFDLGNVLVHIDMDAVWKGLPEISAAERDRLRPAVTEVYMEFEHGRVSPDEFLDRLTAIFDGRFDRTRLASAFGAIIRTPVEGMEQIVRTVAGRVTTALVSNTNSIHYDDSIRRVPAMTLLPVHFVSFRMGVMKPDTGFYQEIIRTLGMAPDRMLFIDDVEKNVAGATRAGMLGHLFTGPDPLRQELSRLDLDPGPRGPAEA